MERPQPVLKKLFRKHLLVFTSHFHTMVDHLKRARSPDPHDSNNVCKRTKSEDAATASKNGTPPRTVDSARNNETSTISTEDRAEGREPRVFTMEEVSQHDSEEKGIWIVIFGKVYDVTDFTDHPGGWYVLKEVAGCDATFEYIDARHPEYVDEEMAEFEIGTCKSS